MNISTSLFEMAMDYPCSVKTSLKIKHKDDIAHFIENERYKFLEAMYLSEISKPDALCTLKYRMQAPDFFNYTVTRFFSQEILKIVEHEGKSYDWELFGKNISVKSMQIG